MQTREAMTRRARVGCVRAEPRKADRYAAADRRPGRERRLRAEPDDRRLASRLASGHVCAVQVDLACRGRPVDDEPLEPAL